MAAARTPGILPSARSLLTNWSRKFRKLPRNWQGYFLARANCHQIFPQKQQKTNELRSMETRHQAA
jgi:hypothetical protein